jgi:anti-anti-sigma factor
VASLSERRSRRHVCAIARSDAARAEIATAWIAEGLGTGEQVVWVEPEGGSVREWLHTQGVDWADAEASGRFGTAAPEDVLRIATAADIPARIAAVAAMTREAVASGYAGLRLGGEVAEVLSVMPDVATQLEFEAAWDQLTRTEQLSLMCVYDPRLAVGHSDEAIARHPRELSDGLVRAAAVDGVVHLAGELDLSNGRDVRRFLDVATHDATVGDVRLDSRDCTFMDVAGASALLSFARARAPQRVRVLAAPPSLSRILTLTGAAHELDLAPSG